jgi:hypothetical protein
MCYQDSLKILTQCFTLTEHLCYTDPTLKLEFSLQEKYFSNDFEKAMKEPESLRGSFVKECAKEIEKNKGRGKVTSLQLVKESAGWYNVVSIVCKIVYLCQNLNREHFCRRLILQFSWEPLTLSVRVPGTAGYK